jgi:hypothetical protein
MDGDRDNQSRYQYRTKVLLLWLIVWYIGGFLYMLISFLPQVTIWSLEESITIEENFIVGSIDIESGSIVNAFILAAIWPILCGFLFTGGWILAGEFVGNSCFPLFGIGFISGLITVSVRKIIRTDSKLKKEAN